MKQERAAGSSQYRIKTGWIVDGAGCPKNSAARILKKEQWVGK